MFEIMSWREDNNALGDNKWLEKIKNPTVEGRFTERQMY